MLQCPPKVWKLSACIYTNNYHSRPAMSIFFFTNNNVSVYMSQSDMPLLIKLGPDICMYLFIFYSRLCWNTFVASLIDLQLRFVHNRPIKTQFRNHLSDSTSVLFID